MITVKNAESYLKTEIADDIKKVWETFKDFCKEAIEGEEDKEYIIREVEILDKYIDILLAGLLQKLGLMRQSFLWN